MLSHLLHIGALRMEVILAKTSFKLLLYLRTIVHYVNLPKFFKWSSICSRHCDSYFFLANTLVKLIMTNSDKPQKADFLPCIILINFLNNVVTVYNETRVLVHWCDKTSAFPNIRNKSKFIVFTSFAEFSWPHPN